MLDVEPVILDELERLALEPAPRADWADVLLRCEAASKLKPGHRLLLVAAVALLSAAVVAVAIASTLGGFHNWLSGQPGAPASPKAQQAFERATRSWLGFPHSAQLRRLVITEVDGVHYELDGFRGAGSLCLRLTAAGGASATRLACAPLSALRAAKAPALVLGADSPIGRSGMVGNGLITLVRPVAAVSFGVLADGVRQVEITHRESSATDVYVSGDAFLAISPRLSPFNGTATIVVSIGGAHAPVPFVHGATPYGPASQVVVPKPTGPSNVERRLAGGAIRWFAQRQPRGTAIPPGVHNIAGVSAHVIFARVIKPDPSMPERLVVSISPAGRRYFGGRLRNNRQVCAELIGGRYQGGDCWPAGRLFSTAPFAFGESTQIDGQVTTVAGLVDDDVAKLTAFPAIGAPRTLPTHDNGFFVAATVGEFPLRLVAYDHNGVIIGNKVFNGPFASAPYSFATPAPGAKWTKVITNASGSLWETRSTSGGTCLLFKLGMSCDETVTPRGLTLGVSSDRSHTWVEGLVGAKIRALRLILRNGHVIALRPVHGYVLYRFARSGFGDHEHMLKQIDGLDARGETIVSERYG